MSHFSRREFLKTTAIATSAISLPSLALAKLRQLEKLVRIGLIADLHHDIMHDGEKRLDAFLNAMKKVNPDAILQMGDFARPAEKNIPLIEKFNEAHAKPLHVLGNHEIDGGYSWEQAVKAFGMKNRYYSEDISGLRLIVLDGNEKPKNHKGGYPSHISQEQIEWLKNELEKHDGPILIVSHQPLAGPFSIDNEKAVRSVLDAAADKIILSINGHTHIDVLKQIKNINYLHINSASYQWVGGKFKHESYPKEIHKKFPWISHTCPYRDSLFTTLTFDPIAGVVKIEASKTEWVGKDPEQLGKKNPILSNLSVGKELTPEIRERNITVLAGKPE